jgi:hypothetical protein
MMHTLVKLYRLAKKAKGYEFAQRIVQRLYRARYERDELDVAKYAWDESKHPRGQPENAGEFAEVNVSIGNSGGKPGEGVVHARLQHGSTITGLSKQPESDVKLAEESEIENYDRWNLRADSFVKEVEKAIAVGDNIPKDVMADYRRITAIAPQSRTPEQRSSIEVELKNNSITKIDKCKDKSVNEVFFITLENGSKSVYKPKSSERPGMRKDIPDGTYAIRGVAFYEVSKIVGLDDLVPVTVMKTIPGEPDSIYDEKSAKESGWGDLVKAGDTKKGTPDKEGSCQEFCENCDVAYKAPVSKMYDGLTDSIRAMAFDFVMGNTDRHQGNWMIHHSGKLRLIDNDLTLPEGHSERTVQMMGMSFRTANVNAHFHNALAHHYKNVPLDRAKAAWKDKMPEIAKVLKANGISDKAIELVEKRYEIMMKAPTFDKAIEELSKIIDKSPHPLD